MNLKDDDVVSAVALVVDGGDEEGGDEEGGDSPSGDGFGEGGPSEGGPSVEVAGEGEQGALLDADEDDLRGDPEENGNSPLA
jgi:hypothetical protein